MKSKKVLLTRCPQVTEYKKLTYADIVSGSAISDIVLPAGVKVVDVDVAVRIAFNAATTAVVDAGYVGSTPDLDYFIDNQDIKTAAVANVAQVALGRFGQADSTDDTVRLTVTTTGAAATAGELYWRVEYAYAEDSVFGGAA